MVGDGADINTTKDPCLHNKRDFHVEDSHIYVGRSESVSHWFVPGSKQWDDDLVNENFHEEDAKAILVISVPQREVRDKVAWVRSMDGQYSVKIGYKLWLDQNIGVVTVIQSKGWKKLWRLTIPYKMKIFIWRFFRNNIRVRNRLNSKSVSD